MEKKLLYKIAENYDFNNLERYGFHKTEPKQNPWWQCVLQIDWSTGLGFYIESLSVNIKTRNIYLDYKKELNNFRYQEKIDRMLNDGLLIESTPR